MQARRIKPVFQFSSATAARSTDFAGRSTSARFSFRCRAATVPNLIEVLVASSGAITSRITPCNVLNFSSHFIRPTHFISPTHSPLLFTRRLSYITLLIIPLTLLTQLNLVALLALLSHLSHFTYSVLSIHSTHLTHTAFPLSCRQEIYIFFLKSIKFYEIYRKKFQDGVSSM